MAFHETYYFINPAVIVVMLEIVVVLAVEELAIVTVVVVIFSMSCGDWGHLFGCSLWSERWMLSRKQ